MSDYVKPFSVAGPTASDVRQSADLEAVRTGCVQACLRLHSSAKALQVASVCLVPPESILCRP